MDKETQRRLVGLWCSRISTLNESRQFGNMGHSSRRQKTFFDTSITRVMFDNSKRSHEIDFNWWSRTEAEDEIQYNCITRHIDTCCHVLFDSWLQCEWLHKPCIRVSSSCHGHWVASTPCSWFLRRPQHCRLGQQSLTSESCWGPRGHWMLPL